MMSMLRRTAAWRPMLAVLLLAGSLSALNACAMGVMYVRMGPPPPRMEMRAHAPGSDYVWLPGYYRWDGVAYVWVGGYWARPPHPRAHWVPGRWEHTRRGWRFIQGHWRRR